jgi:hypothetical protein
MGAARRLIKLPVSRLVGSAVRSMVRVDRYERNGAGRYFIAFCSCATRS